MRKPHTPSFFIRLIGDWTSSNWHFNCICVQSLDYTRTKRIELKKERIFLLKLFSEISCSLKLSLNFTSKIKVTQCLTEKVQKNRTDYWWLVHWSCSCTIVRLSLFRIRCKHNIASLLLFYCLVTTALYIVWIDSWFCH